MGWRDNVNSAVKAKGRTTSQENPGASQTFRISRVGFGVLAHPFVVRAALKRGISLSGYLRRAALAFAAHDLGLNRIDLFELDAAVAPPGRIGSLPTKDLDEKIYGSWEVQGDGTRSERSGEAPQD